MDWVIYGILEILTDYDSTLRSALVTASLVDDDERCGRDTMALMEGVLVAIMIDRAEQLIPDDEQEQEAILRAAERLDEAFDKLPEELPLLYQVSMGYALALSQSNHAWRPWERIIDFLLEEDCEPENTH